MADDPISNVRTSNQRGYEVIPDFTDDGNLPPGVHAASLDELAARFGQESELRRVQMESICWLVDLAQRAGAERLIVNGSFVSDAVEPNDVDCVLLVGAKFLQDRSVEVELEEGLPFIDLHVVGPDDFDRFVTHTFGTDRFAVPKGVVEIPL